MNYLFNDLKYMAIAAEKNFTASSKKLVSSKDYDDRAHVISNLATVMGLAETIRNKLLENDCE